MRSTHKLETEQRVQKILDAFQSLTRSYPPEQPFKKLGAILVNQGTGFSSHPQGEYLSAYAFRAALGHEFQIILSDSEWDALKTLGDLYACLESKPAHPDSRTAHYAALTERLIEARTKLQEAKKAMFDAKAQVKPLELSYNVARSEFDRAVGEWAKVGEDA